MGISLEYHWNIKRIWYNQWFYPWLAIPQSHSPSPSHGFDYRTVLPRAILNIAELAWSLE
jgi:hypothetical protein